MRTELNAQAKAVTAVRRLKALVILLIISNLALGLIAFYYLRAIDRKYSDLIGRTVPALNDLQELTTVTMQVMHNTNPETFGSATPGQIAARVETGISRDHELRGEILKFQWPANDASQRRNLRETGDQFDQQLGQLIVLFRSGRTTEATQSREQTLRPDFDRYVAATSRAADLFQAQTLKASNGFTARTLSISNFMLGFATWPLIALCLIFLVTSALALALLFLFDRKLT